MSINEIKAAAYSEKCESRRKRKISRRERRLNRFANATLAFSVTALVIVSTVAMVLYI